MTGSIDAKLEPKVIAPHTLRVRPFQNGDAQKVRDLFMLAMVYAPGSPRHTALRSQLTHPSSIVMYVLFMGGFSLSLSPSTRAIGMVLCLSLLGVFAGLRWFLSTFFVSYCRESLRDDLADIGRHYSVPEGAGKTAALLSSGPNCFWVVEAYSDATGYREIVGIVGLDSSTNDDETTAELRRMVVSPHHRKLGIGQLLLSTLITHARERGLASIFLTTTNYQPPAIRIYERMGWVVQNRIAVWKALPTFLEVIEMKLDLVRC